MKNKRGKNKNFIQDNFFWKNKQGTIPFYIIAILIAVALIAIVMITLFVLKGTSVSLIDRIKDLFKIG
jgi:hypothetical protein